MQFRSHGSTTRGGWNRLGSHNRENRYGHGRYPRETTRVPEGVSSPDFFYFSTCGRSSSKRTSARVGTRSRTTMSFLEDVHATDSKASGEEKVRIRKEDEPPRSGSNGWRIGKLGSARKQSLLRATDRTNRRRVKAFELRIRNVGRTKVLFFFCHVVVRETRSVLRVWYRSSRLDERYHQPRSRTSRQRMRCTNQHVQEHDLIQSSASNLSIHLFHRIRMKPIRWIQTDFQAYRRTWLHDERRVRYETLSCFRS